MNEDLEKEREDEKRVIGMRKLEVKIIGGMVMNERGIEEMRKGEGKKMMEKMKVYIKEIEGKGVNVVKVKE